MGKRSTLTDTFIKNAFVLGDRHLSYANSFHNNRQIHNDQDYSCISCEFSLSALLYILNIWVRGLFSLSIYSTRDRSCCMSSTSWKPSPLGKFYLLIITTLTTRWHRCTVVRHYKPIFASTFFRRCQPIKAN